MEIKKITKALRDYVVVLKEAETEKTAGGLLYKPATVEDKFIVGKVVAVGSGQIASDGSIIPMEVHINDKVLFAKHAAVELKTSDQTLLVLREDQILCVVE